MIDPRTGNIRSFEPTPVVEETARPLSAQRLAFLVGLAAEVRFSHGPVQKRVIFDRRQRPLGSISHIHPRSDGTDVLLQQATALKERADEIEAEPSLMEVLTEPINVLRGIAGLPLVK